MRSIELFAGAGGLGLGVSMAGFDPVEIVEWDRWCCDTIRQNRDRGVAAVASWPLVEGDVREISFNRYEGQIDLVSGGPPCQPFSLGGKHQGHKDLRDMWPEAVRAVRETKPRAFLFENVKGLTREAFENYLAYIVHQLSYPELVRKPQETWVGHLIRLERHHTKGGNDGDLSYRVVYRVLNAADYGIPQRRERVVFVGFRGDLGIEWSFPEATHSSDALVWAQARSNEYWDKHQIPGRDRSIPQKVRERAGRLAFKPATQPWNTVRDAIGDMPDPELEPSKATAFLNHRYQPGARSYHGHTGSPLDEPAKTLKAGVHGVPGGENMLARPDGTVRYFSVREGARLQTFPDDFLFHGSWTETMRQLGNAVPVTLARTIGSSVARHLALAG